MIRKSFAAALAALAVLCSLLATPAQARREWQAFGGNGDATSKIECPAGQVMVGFQGHAGAWIDQLRIMCAPLTGEFSTGAAQGFGGYFGGRGGGAVQAACPADSVLTRIGFDLSPDKGKVVDIYLGCTHADGHMTSDYYGAFGDTEHCAKALGIIPQGCNPGEKERVQTCPQEQMVGLTVRSGQDVNAIGVICDRRSLPLPPGMSARRLPGGSVSRANASNVTPARPAAAAGTPSVLRITSAGPWKLITDDGDRDTLILQPQGGGLNGLHPVTHEDNQMIPFAGNLVSADGNADGFIQGMMQADFSRILTFNYSRKDGTTGSCRLIYAIQGQSLNGTCQSGGKTVEANALRGSWPARAVKRASPVARNIDEPAEAPPRAAGQRQVAVKLDVDVFARPGGEGKAIGSLDAGTAGVTLVEPCRDDWCHVRWPGHEGWVYSGSDYNALGQ